MFSALSKITDYVKDNFVSVDPAEEEKKLRTSTAPFLLQEGEKVVFAFVGRGGSGRDSYYLTDRRIIVRDVTGITGSSVKYRSTPYSHVKAWSVSTAGGGFDSDSELEVWASGMPHLEIEFSKDKVDLFAINMFLNSKILPKEQEYKITIPEGVSPGAQFQFQVGGQTLSATCPKHLSAGMTMMVTVPSTNPGTYSPGAPKPDEKGMSGFLNWIGDDAREVDAKELEQRLKTCPAVLLPDERVEMAFKSGRDYTVLSSKRLLIVDPRGITGKKVVYRSVLWKCARAFAVETAGRWDRDCELKIWTNINEMKCIEQDLRKTRVDLMAVQRFFCDKILGMDSQPHLLPAIDPQQGLQDTGGSFLAWCGDDVRQLDASQADAQFHRDPPILQGCERCEVAFKGRRDMILFTTKRVISIDVQGWSGKKKEYKSIPWSTIKAFGVKSAGSFLDKDSEMMLWTDIMYDPPPPQEDPPPPSPGMSYLEFDFQKDKVDLMAIQRYLAMRCLPLTGLPVDVPVPAGLMAVSPTAPKTLETCLNWLGSDGVQLNAGDVQAHLEDAQILVQGEKVAMAFKAGRDTFILTNRRVFTIDVQGFSGKRVAYVSIPYSSVRAFAVESAGTFDRDAELKIYTRNLWTLNKVKQDFRKGRADILAIQSYMCSMMMATYSGASANDTPPASFPQDVGGVSGFLAWLGDDAQQIATAAVEKRLREDTPILMHDETVDAAFKCGRDMYVHTSKRLLFVDVQGWSGKKVEYQSVPLRYCTGFEVKTAGKFDLDAELRIYTDVPSIGRINQDMRKGKTDVPAVWRMIQNKLLI